MQWTSTCRCRRATSTSRSEEHTSELQSLRQLVCPLLLEKKTCHQYVPVAPPPSPRRLCVGLRSPSLPPFPDRGQRAQNVCFYARRPHPSLSSPHTPSFSF